VAHDGQKHPSHGDVAWRWNTGEGERGTEALPCAASEKCGRGEMVGSWWSCCGGGEAMRGKLGGRQGDGNELGATAAAMDRGGNEGGSKK